MDLSKKSCDSVKVRFQDGNVKKVSRKLIYDASYLNGNMVIVGKPATGKTEYVCRCLNNGYYKGVKEIYYVAPSETVSEKRAQELERIFSNYDLHIYSGGNKEELENSLDEIKKICKAEIDDRATGSSRQSKGGELPKITKLMILDDMGMIADTSRQYTNFMTRARKMNFATVTIFHDIGANTGIWSMINSVSNRFVLFSVGNPSSIANFLSKFCLDRQKLDGYRYGTKKNNWLFSAYKREVQHVGEHLLIDVDAADKRLNCGSPFGQVRSLTGGIYNNETDTYDYQIEYIHRNAGKGEHSSFTSERVSIAEDIGEKENRRLLYVVKENIRLTESGQCYRSKKIENFKEQKTALEISQILDHEDNSYKRKRTFSDSSTNSSDENQFGGVAVPKYLRKR